MRKLGKKAENLTLLEKSGFNVPRFVVLEDIPIGKNIFELVSEIFMMKYGTAINSNLSIRSSGTVSTPGIMKTVLDVKPNNDAVLQAFEEVRKSSKSERLKKYLKIKEVENFSCSYIFQEMVYGNHTNESCSGALLTINPYDDRDFYFEVLFNSLGDNLMSGLVKLDEQTSIDIKLKNKVGYKNLEKLVEKLKSIFDTPQEVEFVIQDTEVFILQTRDYKVNLGKCITYTPPKDFIGQGLAVNNFSCIGLATFYKENASEHQIIITEFTDFEDTPSMLNAAGIITLKGGRLSHAAIIANEFNLPCVVGANFQEIPKEGQQIMFDRNGTIFSRKMS